MIRAASHRIRQFFGALRPRVTVPERVDAYRCLSPREQRLFETMTLRDQQHGIIVMRRVRDRVGDDVPLLAAAMLHDCGKGQVGVWQRVLHVVLAAAPAIRARVASESGAAWRQSMWRLLHHPRLGAALAAAAGADPEVVRIIREQDTPEPDARLAILQAADEM